LEGIFEPDLERFGTAVAVIVVAEHDDEVERKSCARGGDLARHLNLLLAPATRVADHLQISPRRTFAGSGGLSGLTISGCSAGMAWARRRPKGEANEQRQLKNT
jgi:hypothetical protein